MKKYRKQDCLLTALYTPRIVYTIQVRYFFIFWKDIEIFRSRKDRDDFWDNMTSKIFSIDKKGKIKIT